MPGEEIQGRALGLTQVMQTLLDAELSRPDERAIVVSVFFLF